MKRTVNFRKDIANAIKNESVIQIQDQSIFCDNIRPIFPKKENHLIHKKRRYSRANQMEQNQNHYKFNLFSPSKQCNDASNTKNNHNDQNDRFQVMDTAKNQQIAVQELEVEKTQNIEIDDEFDSDPYAHDCDRFQFREKSQLIQNKSS